MTTIVQSHVIRTRPLYRLLYKRLRLPQGMAHSACSGLKRLTAAAEVVRRKRLAAELPAAQAGDLHLSEQQAARRFDAAAVPGAGDAAAYCATLFQAFRDSGQAAQSLQRNPSKRFLLSVAAGDELLAHPDLLRFMISRPLLAAASRYLGTVPRLEGAAVWWTPPNESADSSQAWHVDELAPRQVKCILNCSAVDDDSGPLHFLPADVSERVRAGLGHRRGRLRDDQVLGRIDSAELQRATGPAGSGVLFDSSRCLHYGSRGNVTDRLVLTFHYLPVDAPTETRYHLSSGAAAALTGELDDLQLLALGSARG